MFNLSELPQFLPQNMKSEVKRMVEREKNPIDDKCEEIASHDCPSRYNLNDDKTMCHDRDVNNRCLYCWEKALDEI
jgi:hypothetical protein